MDGKITYKKSMDYTIKITNISESRFIHGYMDAALGCLEKPELPLGDCSLIGIQVFI